MRLACVISSLRPGGAEGVMARIASGLAARGHDIRLLTLDSADPGLPLHPAVRVRALGLQGSSAGPLTALAANLRRVSALRRALRSEEPEAVLSFMTETNVLTLLAAGRSLPVVVAERVHPAHTPFAPAWSALRRAAYPLAAGIAVQTADVPEFFAPGLRKRCAVIPNPVLPPGPDMPGPKRAEQGELEPAVLRTLEGWRRQGRRTLLGLGRLVPQKGFDLLLQAFADLAPAHSDWRLMVLGDGAERPRLEALARELGMSGSTIFPGRTAQPQAALRQADLFVLPSRFEGFPNALLDALACGVPAVAFDCPSGPADIVRHEVDGLLVPPGDVAALSTALARLMADADQRRGMAARAPEVLTRFGLEKVLDLWEALFIRVLAARGR
jgi:glycosyltransferase involved in cell wall biosynthesis